MLLFLCSFTSPHPHTPYPIPHTPYPIPHTPYPIPKESVLIGVGEGARGGCQSFIRDSSSGMFRKATPKKCFGPRLPSLVNSEECPSLKHHNVSQQVSGAIRVGVRTFIPLGNIVEWQPPSPAVICYSYANAQTTILFATRLDIEVENSRYYLLLIIRCNRIFGFFRSFTLV